jgi:hypothetical protein
VVKHFLLALVAWGAAGGAPAARAQIAFSAGPPGVTVESVEPTRVAVGEVLDLRLRLRVGEAGIGTGGSLLVDLPKQWFADPFPLVKKVQTVDREAPHFLGAECETPGVELEVSISHLNVDGKSERFRHLATVSVVAGRLRSGDLIDVVFLGTSAPTVAGTSRIGIAAAAGGTDGYRRLDAGARVEVVSGPPVHLTVQAPSQAVVGRRSQVQVTLFDRFYNPATGARGRVRVRGLGRRELSALLGPSEQGRVSLRWKPRSEGLHWLEASAFVAAAAGGEDHMVVTGGPIRVARSSPPLQVYWGDLHSHSEISKDAMGTGDFEFARDVSRLDFFASTEHHSDDGFVSARTSGPGITAAEWQRVRAAVRSFDDPGRFVTLLGYECSLGGGHHNVFFRGLEGSPCPAQGADLGELWGELTAGEAFTVPHHLGIQWGRVVDDEPTGPEVREVRTADLFSGPGPVLDWGRAHDRRLRPALEIYSAHGQSELFDPADELSYERVRFTAGRSSDGPHYARDAWASGLRMAVVAASDNHIARPGLSHYGLTAVLAPELTREAIFDALLAGRSWATTGERILLDFSVAGAGLGEEARARGRIRGAVQVAAPSRILEAEVLSWHDHEGEWRVAASWDRPGQALEAGFEDEIVEGWRLYYLRVELELPTGRRRARAWSSPIWVEAASAP